MEPKHPRMHEISVIHLEASKCVHCGLQLSTHLDHHTGECKKSHTCARADTWSQLQLLTKMCPARDVIPMHVQAHRDAISGGIELIHSRFLAMPACPASALLDVTSRPGMGELIQSRKHDGRHADSKCGFCSSTAGVDADHRWADAGNATMLDHALRCFSVACIAEHDLHLYAACHTTKISFQG